MKRVRASARLVERPARLLLVVALGLVPLVLIGSQAGAAQATVGLGTAGSFAVLAGQGVTNTGPSVVNGDLGTCPNPAITGFPPGIVNGTIHANDALACQAQLDLTAAYNDAGSRAPTVTYPGPGPTELGGMTLTPGVYSSAAGFAITGTLTLDAQGDPNAVFIFQSGSTLITAPNSRVSLVNGAQACNVFFRVVSSATLGVNSRFVGTILALTSISANTGARVTGRLLTRNGSVTLQSNTITRPACTTTTTTSPTGSTTTTSPTGSTTTTSPTGATSTTLPPGIVLPPGITFPGGGFPGGGGATPPRDIASTGPGANRPTGPGTSPAGNPPSSPAADTTPSGSSGGTPTSDSRRGGPPTLARTG